MHPDKGQIFSTEAYKQGILTDVLNDWIILVLSLIYPRKTRLRWVI